MKVAPLVLLWLAGTGLTYSLLVQHDNFEALIAPPNRPRGRRIALAMSTVFFVLWPTVVAYLFVTSIVGVIRAAFRKR